MKTKYNFLSRFGVFLKRNHKTTEQLLRKVESRSKTLRLSDYHKKKGISDPRLIGFISVCIDVFEHFVPAVSRRTDVMISFRVNAIGVLHHIEDMLNKFDMEPLNKLYVNSSSIHVEYTFCASVLRQFVFVNYCLDLPAVTHLIKYENQHAK